MFNVTVLNSSIEFSRHSTEHLFFNYAASYHTGQPHLSAAFRFSLEPTNHQTALSMGFKCLLAFQMEMRSYLSGLEVTHMPWKLNTN